MIWRVLVVVGALPLAGAAHAQTRPAGGWTTLGATLLERGDWEGAERAFQRALGDADSLRARLELAELRYLKGEYAAAAREFDRFIDRYNGGGRLSSDHLVLVARALTRLGARDPQLFKDALRAYDEAIAADSSNLEARVRLGNLFLAKYNGTEARATFEPVLKRNPRNAEALLGLARTARFEGDAEALDLAQRAVEVNGDHAPARAFLAELHLEREELDAAAAEAGRALAVNPASLEGLTVLGAVRFLRHDSAGFRTVERRVLERYPRPATFYHGLAELAVRGRLYREAASFAARAVALDSVFWPGFAALGINQLRLGAMADGRRHLEAAFRGDPYDVLTKNTLDLLDVLDRYRVARQRGFELVMDTTEADLLGLYLGPLAREAFDSLTARYGKAPPPPLRVEVYSRHADFSVRTVGLVGLGALGASFGPVIVMDSPSALPRGEGHWGSTLWHELAHSFHLHLSNHRVPRWLTEGLAVYEERRARPGWGAGVTPAFLIAFLRGELHPVSELSRAFTSPESPQALGHAYYQASLVCEMIARDHGVPALRRIVEGFAAGSPADAVFRSALGVEIAAFDRRFDEYVRSRFAVPLATLGPLARSEEPRREGHPGDPKDFAAQLAAGRAALEAGDLENAERFLELAKVMFVEYGGADSPYWYLAQLHQRRGGRVSLLKAAGELERLTALNAGHYQALLELAEVRDSLGDVRGSADALNRAMYAYPLEPAVHRRLAEQAGRLGDWTLAVRERRAVVALAPPDLADAYYELAQASYRAGDLAGARESILRALERAPSFAKAQELLLTIRGAQRPDEW